MTGVIGMRQWLRFTSVYILDVIQLQGGVGGAAGMRKSLRTRCTRVRHDRGLKGSRLREDNLISIISGRQTPQVTSLIYSGAQPCLLLLGAARPCVNRQQNYFIWAQLRIQSLSQCNFWGIALRHDLPAARGRMRAGVGLGYPIFRERKLWRCFSFNTSFVAETLFT